MRFQRWRRVLLAAACVSSVLLAACGGGGQVVSQFHPSRVVAFGDAFSDLGQRGARYTVNDGSASNWTQQLAAHYGLSLAASASGGSSYATGSARVVATPDAAGNAATPTIAAQIDSFLASQAPQPGDLVVISAGIGDIVAEMATPNSGTTDRVKQAGRDFGAQIRRLVAAGAKHVLVVGTYNLGRSPWALNTAQGAMLTDLSTQFNSQLLTAIVDLGSNVLYVDAAFYFNLVTGSPASYGLTNVTNPACNSVDAGPGIGIGAGHVNSALCTPSTLALPSDSTLFADEIYITPGQQVRFGDYVYDRLRVRF